VCVEGTTEATGDPYSQVKQMDKRRAEPEKIRIWREEQAEMLKKKGLCGRVVDIGWMSCICFGPCNGPHVSFISPSPQKFALKKCNKLHQKCKDVND